MADQKRTPSPAPLPPHPKQANLIAQQEQRERISPPRIRYKSSPFVETINKDHLINTSPVANLNIGGQNEARNQNSQPLQKREELIEAKYLKRILSKEINTADNVDQNIKNPQQDSSGQVPACCYAPPYINYVNGCKEIKKSLNYGNRTQIIDQTPCNHYLIGNETCEKCCKLITLNRNIFSLHCAWHHQLLTCIVCKVTLSDIEHHVFRGKIYCDDCFERARGLHAIEMQTIHKRQ